jgi:hypothetical protein
MVRVRRSSSRGSAAPTSYVALLRKQKATVWCDRSQAEDPRIAASIRLAKERAEREVSQAPHHLHHHSYSHGGSQYGSGSFAAGPRTTPPNANGSGSSSSFTSGVRKIRHQGKAQAVASFSKGANMAGTGVPVRLLSGELDDDDENPILQQQQQFLHPNSQQGYQNMQQPGAQAGMGKDDDWGIDASFYGTADPTEAEHVGGGNGGSNGMKLQLHPVHSRTNSENMDMLEEETPTTDTFGDSFDNYRYLGRSDTRTSSEEEKDDDLKRRGSVDDRAMTMSGVRLFVANPDLDD